MEVATACLLCSECPRARSRFQEKLFANTSSNGKLERDFRDPFASSALQPGLNYARLRLAPQEGNAAVLGLGMSAEISSADHQTLWNALGRTPKRLHIICHVSRGLFGLTPPIMDLEILVASREEIK